MKTSNLIVTTSLLPMTIIVMVNRSFEIKDSHLMMLITEITEDAIEQGLNKDE